MCGARAALAHLNTLLAVGSGAALVACFMLMAREGGALQAAWGGQVAGGWLVLSLYGAAPLLLALSLLGAGALVAGPASARALLVLYCGLCQLAAGAAAGAAVVAGVQLYNWLNDSSNFSSVLLALGDSDVQPWLHPLVSLFSVKTFLPFFQEQRIRAGVVAALCACAGCVVVVGAAGAVALCARPRRTHCPRYQDHKDSSLRRCSSVYYEPSAPPPAHLNNHLNNNHPY